MAHESNSRPCTLDAADHYLYNGKELVPGTVVEEHSVRSNTGFIGFANRTASCNSSDQAARVVYVTWSAAYVVSTAKVDVHNCVRCVSNIAQLCTGSLLRGIPPPLFDISSRCHSLTASPHPRPPLSVLVTSTTSPVHVSKPITSAGICTKQACRARWPRFGDRILTCAEMAPLLVFL